MQPAKKEKEKDKELSRVGARWIGPFCWERIHPGCSDALLRVASVYSNLHRIIDVARTNRAGSNLLQQISRNKRKGKDLPSAVFEFRSNSVWHLKEKVAQNKQRNWQRSKHSRKRVDDGTRQCTWSECSRRRVTKAPLDTAIDTNK